jgi:hypothetical protein
VKRDQLARACALALTLLAGSAVAAAAGSNGLAADPAAVLAGAAASGSVTQRAGETYFGPGPLTVGYLGSKKQLVLPNGPWVLLSMGDRNSQGSTANVPMTMLLFGQFKDEQLKTLLAYQFNGRGAIGRVNWLEPETCAAKGGPSGSRKVELKEGTYRACGWVVRQSRLPDVTEPAWAEALAAVSRLGATVPTGSLVYTRAWAVDGAVEYLALRRVDFDAGRTLDVEARTRWLEAYASLFLEGFRKRISAGELEPGLPPGGAQLTLPD